MYNVFHALHLIVVCAVNKKTRHDYKYELGARLECSQRGHTKDAVRLCLATKGSSKVLSSFKRSITCSLRNLTRLLRDLDAARIRARVTPGVREGGENRASGVLII
jgi:hypothetical protein